MINKKITFLNNILDVIPYKTFDFIKNVSKNIQIGFKTQKNNYKLFNEENINLYKKSVYLENNKSICPHCGSKHNTKHEYTKRKLVVLEDGEVEIKILRYKCKNCKKTFNTDLSEFVLPNCNITIPVITEILKLFSIYGSSIYKIKNNLKQSFNVDISHQTIENIILSYEYKNKAESWTYSGYYSFDSLWVKIKGEWNYLFALSDTKMNTIVAREIYSDESKKNVKEFLTKATQNQERISITTDLKRDYRQPITDLKFKHQFCIFHTKQKLNRDIHTYITQEKVDKEEKKEIIKIKKEIFEILDCKDIKQSIKKLNELVSYAESVKNVISDIIWKFIVPYFKNLTFAIENKNIVSTNNKIENMFQKIFPKEIKKRMKTIKGVLTRFSLKQNYWDAHNKV